jgi:hypothetical protein
MAIPRLARAALMTAIVVGGRRASAAGHKALDIAAHPDARARRAHDRDHADYVDPAQAGQSRWSSSPVT